MLQDSGMYRLYRLKNFFGFHSTFRIGLFKMAFLTTKYRKIQLDTMQKYFPAQIKTLKQHTLSWKTPYFT